MFVDHFINAQAGFYRNRLLGDTFLNRLEDLPFIPRGLFRRLRGAREHEFFFERPYRMAHRYRRILGNRGAVHVTTDVRELRKHLAASIRDNPFDPKILHTGDGGVKEGLTTGINYVDKHNALEAKVAAAFEEIILKEEDAEIEGSLRTFLAGVDLPDKKIQESSLSDVARVVLMQKKVTFSDIENSFTLSEEEKKFAAEHNVTLTNLLQGRVPYPIFGVTGEGTFNVLSNNFALERGTKYVKSLIEQIEQEGIIKCSRLHPLRVEYEEQDGTKKRIYGAMYGHGAIRSFYDLYYTGRLPPGKLQSVNVALLRKITHRKDFYERTKPRMCSYKVTHKSGREEEFNLDTTLCLATVIERLPYRMKFFCPEKGCLHLAATGITTNQLTKKGFMAMPYIGRLLRRTGLKDPEIEHDYTDVTSVEISCENDVRFMELGDIKSPEGVLYDSPKVKISIGPEVMIANPSGGEVRVML